MKYQLVLQFQEEKYANLDWIVEMEDELTAHCINAVVDGHDIGCGEVNIFIDTDTPLDTFENVKVLFRKERSLLDDVKIAYRDFDSDHYICLWPKSLKEFNVS